MEERRLTRETRELAIEMQEGFEDGAARFSVFYDPDIDSAFVEEDCTQSERQSYEDGGGLVFCGDVFKPITAQELAELIDRANDEALRDEEETFYEEQDDD